MYLFYVFNWFQVYRVLQERLGVSDESAMLELFTKTFTHDTQKSWCISCAKQYSEKNNLYCVIF